jgi:hypothetical protein
MIFAGHGAQHFDIFDKFERDGYPSRTISAESKLEGLAFALGLLGHSDQRNRCGRVEHLRMSPR